MKNFKLLNEFLLILYNITSHYSFFEFITVGVTRCAHNARGEKPVVVFLDV
jgi:hypothetical protein